MTEGHQPPTSRRGSADQDTATLPRVTVPPSSPGTPAPSAPAGSPPGRGRAAGANDGWSPVSRSDAPPQSRSDGYPAGSAARPDASRAGWPDGQPGRPDSYPAGDGTGDAGSSGGLSARISAAASTVAAGATTAAVNAKTAIRTAADEAENRAGRPAGRGRGRQPRRARLTLSHVNVYSVFKFSCVLAIALFFVWLIAVGVLYGILDVSGVFDRINKATQQIYSNGKTGNVVTGPVVFGFAIIIGVVNIVLFIALATIGAMIYNLCADLVGGTEVTLSERE